MYNCLFKKFLLSLFQSQYNKYPFEHPNHVLAMLYFKILLLTNKSYREDYIYIHIYVYIGSEKEREKRSEERDRD